MKDRFWQREFSLDITEVFWRVVGAEGEFNETAEGHLGCFWLGLVRAVIFTSKSNVPLRAF